MIRYLGPLLVVAVSVYAILNLRNDTDPLETDADSVDKPRYIIRGARWKRHDETGVVRVDGRAREIHYFDDESAQLSDFSVKMQSKNGRPWEARAPQGYSPPNDRHRLLLSGGVEGDGQWPDGEPLIFDTESVWVDSAADSIRTDAKVTLRSESRFGQARGMKISGKRQDVVLHHDVEIHYVPR